jgi:hypothetical protein
MTTDTPTLGDILNRVEANTRGGELRPRLRRGHLPTCPHNREPPCHWCDWAVITDDVTRLISILEDAELILSTPPSGLLWALVAWSIAEAPTTIKHAGVRPEALEIVLSLCDEVREKQSLVRSALQRESNHGGRIESCAKRIAALSSVAPIVKSPDKWARFLDEPALTVVTDLRRRVEVGRLQILCTYECEQLLTTEVPIVRTVPELSAFRERQNKMQKSVFNDLPKGSFEELALGAMLTDLTEAIHVAADAIAATSGTLFITFSEEAVAYPKMLRRNLWAQCSIDWIRTFIDISGAPCWQFSDHVREILSVPWFAAAALAWNTEAGPIPATTQMRAFEQLASFTCDRP